MSGLLALPFLVLDSKHLAGEVEAPDSLTISSRIVEHRYAVLIMARPLNPF